MTPILISGALPEVGQIGAKSNDLRSAIAGFLQNDWRLLQSQAVVQVAVSAHGANGHRVGVCVFLLFFWNRSVTAQIRTGYFNRLPGRLSVVVSENVDRRFKAIDVGKRRWDYS